ncbi:MAG: hypothetical protein QOI11_3512, partial [Candidatus Eremiobacteraeota bacterium]|nr:hypothetical protein [Candidatus Eremiobacteraeota bacterium]
GVFDDQHHLFRQLHIELPPGALLVATTDGVTESRSPDGEFFGVERFLETATELAEAPPQTIVEEMIARATAHAGERGLHDDVAVLAARFP